MIGSLFGRLVRPTLILIPLIGMVGPARSQCDEEAVWTIYSPTGDIAEILFQGSVAWIGAGNGAIRIDISQVAGGNPDQIKISENEGLISGEITCMTQDRFGNVWIGTKSDGVSVFDGAGNHITDLTSFNELWDDQVTAIGSAGDRMFVVSVDRFTAQGAPEGGGFVVISIAPDGAGGFVFESLPSAASALDVGQVVLVDGTDVWFGTNGNGLWRLDENVPPGQPPVFAEALVQAEGLASNNVKKLAKAPHPSYAGEVLWMGTSGGLQVWDGTTLEMVDVVDDTHEPGTESILDIYRQGNSMYAVVDVADSRDLYRVDIGAPPLFGVPIPKSDVLPDTTYIPREVAVDTSGRIVLGTKKQSFSVRVGSQWIPVPSLGPHAPQVADLALGADGALYFGTGSRPTEINVGNGLGVFRDDAWSSVTRDDGILERETVWVEAWPDSSIWFGSTVNRFSGGVNRLFPAADSLLAYHNAVVVESRRTLGRNVGGFGLDAGSNLWILYGQAEGGISVVEWPSQRITSFPMSEMVSGGNDLLSGIAFDSRGRAWITTRNTVDKPAQLHVIDLNGTISLKSDDVYSSFLMASEVAPLGDVADIVIDVNDTVWIVGQIDVVIGQIGPDFGGQASANWSVLRPTAAQLGGRNPLPYSAAELDWDGNVWLGTDSSGLVRISPDAVTWDWFDEIAGCPLPDQSVSGLHVDREGHQIWIGTLSGGIARLDLSGAAGADDGDRLDPEPYPNPFRPDSGSLRFQTLPNTVPLNYFRIFTLTGELVHERTDFTDTVVWDGLTLGGQIVEPGVYFITAETATGKLYEAKVAVIR